MHEKSNPETDLVLEQLPNGQQAWLRPEQSRRFILPARYWLTDLGRRAVAEYALFGPCLTVAEARAGARSTPWTHSRD